ncbi:hypothetical protein H2204_003356 [Knufia peltigerae]|uniref:Uncharacterized protein n=1 Tax=Knufia peltigerae TaxID=1002370 RepID=A0AA39D096_9EURO|nr:hypothetical protein H2204_003356 [Knufia peltigerae]
MATVFDRPCILKPQDFDVRPLVPGDFATPDRKNVIFMAYCKLGLIRHQTQALQAKSSQDLQQEGQKIVVSLKEWIQTLPEAIHLYSTDNTKAYQREIFELHIAYFAAIIHYCHQLDKVSQVSMGLFPSLVASSCIARLYEEMNYRDDVGHLLTVHNWYSMMASAPLLSSCEEGQEEADISRRELDILETTLGLLRRKWYGARVIHDTIKRLRRGTRVGVSVATPRHPVSPLPLNDAQELFPFPNSLAPRMKLLDDEWARPIFLSDEAELQLPDMDMSWIFDEFAGTYNTAFVNTRDFLDPESAMSLEL